MGGLPSVGALHPFGSLGPPVLMLIAHQVPSDGFLMVAIIMSLGLRQLITPQHQFGRAAGEFDAVEGRMMPLGVVTFGILAEFIGITPALLAGVVGGLSVPVLLALSPVLHLRTTPPAAATS